MNQELIGKLKKGNNDAFKEVFNSFYPALCNFANTFVYDVQISEDIVQEVFITLWDYRNNFDNALSLKSFLYKSVRNKCLNYLKHQKIINKHIDASMNDLENDSSYIDHIIEEETHRLIFNAINELPQNCKKILLLSLNGLTNPEIAEDLNISVNTVKTQKAIAYKQLRIKFKDFYLVFGVLLGL